FDGIPSFASRNIDNEQQNSAARNMSEKFMAESEPVMRAFNQAGYVRDRCAPVIGKFHHTDDWVQCRKGICCHLGMCRRNFSQKRGFARVWITNQARICNCPQLEKEMPLLAFFAFRVLARRAIARALEMDISFSARATPTKHKLLAIPCKIDNQIN